MTTIRLTRTIAVPNHLQLARCRQSPDLGPRIVFFSGGSALRTLCEKLIEYTHHSVHLITPFDSGGSSAEIRKAFDMLAVGDLRNRLMALADQSMKGQPEIYDLFSFRFPMDEPPQALRERLDRMVDGNDDRMQAIDPPMRSLIRNHLKFFRREMPESFNLAGANVGNLILAGGYLNQGRHIDPVIYLFSKLVEVRGTVRPISSANLQLAAELDDGEVIVGQHRITSRETQTADARIKRVFLTDNLQSTQPVTLALKDKVRDLIDLADVICYPPGSFYTSVIANLLPQGVGDAIARVDTPKVYVPNTGRDAEQHGMSLAESVETLIAYLRASSRSTVRGADVLQFVLLDSAHHTCTDADRSAVERLGATVIDLPMITRHSAPLLDPQRLAEALVSLA